MSAPRPDPEGDHLAGFTPSEAAALVAYLRFKSESAELAPQERQRVSEAIASYWQARAEGHDHPGEYPC